MHAHARASNAAMHADAQSSRRASAARALLCAAMQADVEQAHELYQSNQQHVTALQAENAQLRLQLFEAGARRRHARAAPSRGDRRACGVHGA